MMNNERAMWVDSWRVKLNAVCPTHGDELLALVLSQPFITMRRDAGAVTQADMLDGIYARIIAGQTVEQVRAWVTVQPKRGDV